MLVGSAGAEHVTIAPSGTRAAALTRDGSVALWNVATGAPGPRLLIGGRSVKALGFSKDGALLAVGSDDGTIRIWNAESGIRIPFDAEQRSEIIDLAFSANGQRLLSLDKGDNATVWDLQDGAKIAAIDCRSKESQAQEDDTSALAERRVALRGDGKAGLVAWPISR